MKIGSSQTAESIMLKVVSWTHISLWNEFTKYELKVELGALHPRQYIESSGHQKVFPISRLNCVGISIYFHNIHTKHFTAVSRQTLPCYCPMWHIWSIILVPSSHLHQDESVML
jgi:hypothetical protein